MSAPSASGLVDDAIQCLAELPPEVSRAHQFFEDALRLEPESVQVLDAFGVFLCEEGDQQRAVQLLERSVSLRPNEGPEKFLHLAQMTSGEEALQWYTRGSALLDVALSAAQDAELKATEASKKDASKAVRSLRLQVARTRAAIAEMYMTDLCDLPDAEEKCEEALAQGAAASEDCLELQATTAGLRKVQGRIDEATELAVRCAKTVEGCFREQHDLVIGDEDLGAKEPPASQILSDEDIVQLCRTLLDLMQVAEARSLLELLLEKDEEDIQIWVLLGFSHVVEKDPDGARECAKHAMKLCKKMGKDAAVWTPTLRDLMSKAKALPAALPDPGQNKEEADGK